MSDLHLEFEWNLEHFINHPINPVADYLILAGDIIYFTDYFIYNKFWDDVSRNFKKVFCVPGNHEYYKNGNNLNYFKSFELPIRKNISYYNNKVVKLGGYDIVFSTLWSKITDPIKAYRLNDFNYIAYNGEMLSINQYNKINKKSKDFIFKKRKNKNTIIVTHHAPTKKDIIGEFKGNDLNQCFYNELFNEIYDSDIKYWIFGHTHNNINTEIGKTKLVCNQLGYNPSNESFDEIKTIQI